MIKRNGYLIPENYRGCNNCRHQPEPLRMCKWGEKRTIIEPICSRWEELYEDEEIELNEDYDFRDEQEYNDRWNIDYV